MYVKNDSN